MPSETFYADLESGTEFILWGPKLELGIPAMDAQHRGLVDLANRLYREHRTGKRGNETRDAVAKLFEYAARHFVDEEAYFARFNVQALEEHRAAHAAFIARAKEFEERLAMGASAEAAQLLGFLDFWIKRHIGRDDRELLRIARRACIESEDSTAVPESWDYFRC